MRFYLIFIIFSLLFVSACAKDTSKSPEILMGRDCGLDGLKCCDEEPPCSYGQECCIDPNNKDRNYCADECSCGEKGKFCCLGNKCNGGLVCFDGFCYACGEEEEICCPDDNSCNEGFICTKDKCIKCGIIGNPCCENDECFSEREKQVECRNGTCSYCGFDGRDACLTGKKCLPGQLYSNKKCFRCGNSNEPCCDEESNLGYKCNPNKNLVCKLGFCTKAIEFKE